MLQQQQQTNQKEQELKLSLVNNAILDVFKNFLLIKNEQIIFYALFDYIHCLINYLRFASAFSMNLRNFFFLFKK